MRTLRIAAGVEAVSLTVLLINLFATHVTAISSLIGPLHGAAYVTVVTATLLSRSPASSGTRRRAAIPAIGGLLALWRLRDRSRASQP
ncbi:DUF3817 domain-containing protein [Nonomuraea glycinis]|uniref:DUF3817 domain-containing protein n=1 Tax=Nonomuraea glycinis TaxID=2047744 RepID=A0A918A1Q1_9ACTN|nr:DUF3817 domain-containing protein [Nonomuraea glycinis]MCA2177074.1 DUF3817 domain-containing protein [Nonomuraea glycinis]GGP02717.1 hypothetical protein GCM10012278_11050 [Nonomuraea glycinis]